MLLNVIGTKLLGKILLIVAGVLAKRTDNKIDDEIVQALKKAL